MIKKCEECGSNFKVKPSNFNKRKFCSIICRNKRDSRVFLGEGNPAYGKTYRTKTTHPGWAAKIQQSTKGKINIGEKNGMKRLEVRQRMSATRSKRLANDPELTKIISENTKKAWADGKFDGVRVGQCKWFAYTKLDGTIIKLQGIWELQFAKWMDENKLKFKTHRGKIPYLDKCGNKHSYYPDFFVYDWDSWVDIKNDYHYEIQKEKFECIIESNPNINLKILTDYDLKKLGVNLNQTLLKELNAR